MGAATAVFQDHQYPYVADVAGFPDTVFLDDSQTPFASGDLYDCQSTCAAAAANDEDYVAFLYFWSGIMDFHQELRNCQCLTTVECYRWKDSTLRGINRENAYLYSKVPLPSNCTTL